MLPENQPTPTQAQAPNTLQLSSQLKQVYDQYYDDSLEAWREIGARQKAENILHLCRDMRVANLLEIGAGSGILLQKLAQAGLATEYHALDVSSSSLAQIAKKDIPALRSAELFDGYRTNFADKSIDLVVLSHVLEHVEHPRALLREIARIAKQVVIEVPRDYKPGVDRRWQSLVDYGHINLYTPTLLRFLLLAEGFQLMEHRFSFSSAHLLRYPVRTAGWWPRMRVELLLVLRPWAYALAPAWRRETMINAYTVLCQCPDLPTL